MAIEQITTEELSAIVAGLVERGLTFRARPEGDGLWTIELLGGF